MKRSMRAGVVLAAAAMLLGGCGQWASRRAMEKGLAALRQGDYATAAKQFERAARHVAVADAPALYYNLGTADYHLGRYDEARKAFETALELAPGDRDSLVYLGQIRLKRQEWSEASRLFEEAGAGRPPDARLLVFQAEAADGTGRRDAARVLLIRALQADRTCAPALYNLGCLYRDRYMLPSEAIDCFEMFVRTADAQDPHAEKARASIARLKQVLSRMPPPVAPGTKRDPHTAQKLADEGNRQRQAKQWPLAEKAFRDALAADPLCHDALYGWAQMQRTRGAAAEAFRLLLRAASVEPLRQTTVLECAQAALQSKDYADAGRLLDRAIALWPTCAPAYAALALVRQAEGHPAEARVYAEQYVRLAAPGPDRDRYEAWVKTLPR